MGRVAIVVSCSRALEYLPTSTYTSARSSRWKMFCGFKATAFSRYFWADAQKYLEKAVALKPQNIFHRLDLAEVYVDVGKYSKAREQLTTIATLPIADVLDSDYQKEAAQLLDDIKSEKDET